MATPRPRLNRLQIALVLLWPPFAAIVAAVVVDWRAEERLARALSDRAPIAVIDHFAFVRAAGSGAGVDSGVQQIRAISERLRAEGYVVLDRRYVDAAPEPLVVKP